MRGRTTKRIAATAVGFGITAGAFVVAAPAHAVGHDVVGGWSEGDGTVRPERSVHALALLSTPNHRGRAESTTIGGTTHKRAHGWTTWAGVRHYTTAQLEHYWPASGVIATSGRKYGTGGTEAVSPWKAFNPNATSNGNGQARTYYGR